MVAPQLVYTKYNVKISNLQLNQIFLQLNYINSNQAAFKLLVSYYLLAKRSLNN